MTNPQQTSGSGMPTPPKTHTGKEVYRLIMEQLEPDLLPENIPHLNEKYAGESEEETEKRKERYIAAIQEYDRRFEEYKQYRKNQAKFFKKDLLTGVEETFQEEEDDHLASLEAAIQNM